MLITQPETQDLEKYIRDNGCLAKNFSKDKVAPIYDGPF